MIPRAPVITRTLTLASVPRLDRSCIGVLAAIYRAVAGERGGP